MLAPKIIVFDSGLGGLTVYAELKATLVGAQYLYVADNAAFPYGSLQEEQLVTRMLSLFARLIEREKPDVCVIACNTASTIALAPLRQRFDVPFVGTVPAIKTAAEHTKTGLFSVLATPGTVKRGYTHDLIKRYAASCEVTLVGASNLANLAEQHMRAEDVSKVELLREISPAFVENHGRRTDIIVLGCTHFPLLRAEMEKIAPWPVTYIDPSAAIARRTKVVLSQLQDRPDSSDDARPNRMIYTGDDKIAAGNRDYLHGLGLADVYRDDIIG